MPKPTPQQCHALTTFFMTQYEEKFGRPAPVNRNKARWGFDSLLMDYSPSSARELIEFYLDHYEKPNIDWFLFNYEKVDVSKQEHDQNDIITARRREETAQRLEQWRNRWKAQK